MNNGMNKNTSAKSKSNKENKSFYKKRYVLLAGLILVVGMAVYLNWQYNLNNGDFDATEVLANDGQVEDSAKNYGDAAFVNASSDSAVDAPAVSGQANSTDEYFAEARLTRQNTRDEAIALIEENLSSVKVSDEIKAEAALAVAQIAKRIEEEGKIENLIKAKGFTDCMVYLDGENADVVVKSQGLSDSEVIQIKDIVQSQTDLSGNIKIVEVE